MWFGHRVCRRTLLVILYSISRSKEKVTGYTGRKFRFNIKEKAATAFRSSVVSTKE